MTRILIVSGSNQPDSRLRTLLDIAQTTLEAAGAEVKLLDLAEHQLPLMNPADKSQKALPAVKTVRDLSGWADGFILGTPEYHATMSGALKNWFDFHWPEFAGKFAGVVAVAGGNNANLSVTAVKTSFQWCHGFVLPFHAWAGGSDFEGSQLTNDRVGGRVRRLAHDVIRYTDAIGAAWKEAQALGKEAETSGVAGTHIW